MKRSLTLILCGIALAVSGCSSSPELATRYEAEKGYWQAERQFQKLSIRADLVEEDQWRDAARLFMEVGDEFSKQPSSADSSRAGSDARTTRRLSARAWNRAAMIYLGIADTTRALEVFQGVESEFTQIPEVQSGASLSMAQIYEVQGKGEEALAAYRRAMERLDVADLESIPTPLLSVPLSVARLEEGDAQAQQGYSGAAAFYEEVIRTRPGTVDALTARSRLVDIATDSRDWSKAISELRLLEKEMNLFPEPPQDPGKIRYAIAEAQRNGLQDAAAGAQTLKTLETDYPNSPFRARALLSLAQYSYGFENDSEKALAYLDQLDQVSTDSDNAIAAGRLERAGILERENRWGEALEILRRIPVEYPLTEAALQSHLEVAAYYEKTKDTANFDIALDGAREAYRDFLERFPSESLSVQARTRLTSVLMAQERYAEAVDEMAILGQVFQRTPNGARYMLGAAQTAETELKDMERAAAFYSTVAEWFPTTDLGRTAAERAAELRGS